MCKIIDELTSVDKWLDDDYKKSNYYREYLDKVNEDLKLQTI